MFYYGFLKLPEGDSVTFLLAGATNNTELRFSPSGEILRVNFSDKSPANLKLHIRKED